MVWDWVAEPAYPDWAVYTEQEHMAYHHTPLPCQIPLERKKTLQKYTPPLPSISLRQPHCLLKPCPSIDNAVSIYKYLDAAHLIILDRFNHDVYCIWSTLCAVHVIHTVKCLTFVFCLPVSFMNWHDATRYGMLFVGIQHLQISYNIYRYLKVLLRISPIHLNISWLQNLQIPVSPSMCPSIWRSIH